MNGSARKLKENFLKKYMEENENENDSPNPLDAAKAVVKRKIHCNSGLYLKKQDRYTILD